MEKNTAGKWIVFAYGLPDHASDGQPITGDAANITANIRIDGGAANAVDDTNPTELEDGYYVFDITAAEANGDLLSIHPASSTANVQVIGVPGAVWTRPANFNDLSITATTGRTDIASIEGSDATDQINAACDTAIETYRLDELMTAALGSQPTAGSLLGDLTEDDAGTQRFTTNALEQAPSGGGGGDATAANQTTIINHLTDIKGATWDSTNSLEAIHDDVATVDGNVDAILVDTNELQGDWTNGGRLDNILDAAATASALATVDANVDAILVDTGTTLPGTLATIDGNVDSILVDTNELQTDWTNGGRLDLILDAAAALMTTQLTESYAADGVAPTPAQALFLIQQALTDFVISGTTMTIREIDGTTTAATATLDDGTNPTSITRAT